MRRRQMFLRVTSFVTALMLLVWMIPNPVRAEEVGDGWSFDSITGELTIRTNSGPDNFFNQNMDRIELVKNIKIENTVQTITAYAFSDFINLENVTIPSSVNSIDQGAFDACPNLKTIKFNNTIPPTFNSTSNPGNSSQFHVLIPYGFFAAYTVPVLNYFSSGYVLVEYGRVTGLSIDKPVLNFTQIGATQQLTATVEPNDAINQSVSWTSDNSAVASVDTNGIVQAKAYGSATISAKTIDGGYTVTCSVTVMDPATVKIDTQPQNLESRTYGYSGADIPTISITASKTAQAASESVLSYQWYRVKLAEESSDVAFGGNLNSVPVPVGLNAGTYSFYCIVSCGGLSVRSANATFTVNKATPDGITVRFGSPLDETRAGQTLYVDCNFYYKNVMVTTGTKVLKDGDTVIDSCPAGDFTYPCFTWNSITAGPHTLIVEYVPPLDGSGNYTSHSWNIEFTIAKSVQSAFAISPVEGKVFKDNFDLLATGGSGTGAITFSVPADNGVLALDGNKASVIGAGTVTVTATKAEDDLYKSVSATYDVVIEKATPTINLSAYPTSYTYTGSSLMQPQESQVVVSHASYDDIVFTWYKETISDSNRLSGTPSTPGKYVLQASVAETSNYYAASADVTCNISLSTSDVEILANDFPIHGNWYGDDVQISASSYTVSDSMWGPFTEYYTLSGEGHVQKTLYFKRIDNGYITTGRDVDVYIDKTAPSFSAISDGITVGENNWKTIPSTISYDNAYKSAQTIFLSATDVGSGYVQYYYYIDDSGSTMTKNAQELSTVTFSQSLENYFSISAEGRYVIYAFAIDYTGNQSEYICSGGIVIDQTAPAVIMATPSPEKIGDTYYTADIQMNETGTISCVVREGETGQIVPTVDEILSDSGKVTIQVDKDSVNQYRSVVFNGLQPNTEYYVFAVVADQVGNQSNTVYMVGPFLTKKTIPTFDETPTLTGVYGQDLWEMDLTQVSSTNGALGFWSIYLRYDPPVGTTDSFEVTFTPNDLDKYEEVSVYVVPTVNPLSLSSNQITIGEVSGTYMYDGTPKTPSVDVSYRQQSLTTSDYEVSYSNNTNAGTATVTFSGKGNFTGIVTRTFTIQKADAPSIMFPDASAITYGQSLSASNLTGGSSEYGVFSWKDDSSIPESNDGSANCDVIFVPNAETLKNYTISSITQGVPVSIQPAIPDISVNVQVTGSSGARQALIATHVTGVSGGAIPTGTIEFRDTTGLSNILLGTVTLLNGTASYTWSGLADQEHEVTAVYSGNANYQSQQSSAEDFDTRKQTQVVFRINEIAKTYGDQSFTLATTGGSGTGAVTFTSSDTSILSISGSKATILKPGTVTITAIKAEDGTYYQATATRMVTIGKATPTVTVEVRVSGNSGSRKATITARVNGLATGAIPTGTVQLFDSTSGTDTSISSVTLVNGVATYTWNGLSNQIYKVKVKYLGDEKYASVQSSLKSVDTRKQTQAEFRISEIETRTYGDQSFTLITTGGSGTGAVTFTSSDTSILSISGSKATILKPGTVTITAIKAEDGTYYQARATRAVTIGKATPGISIDVAASGDSGSRKATITARVNGVANGAKPTGTVQLYDCTTGTNVKIKVITLDNGVATYTWTGLTEKAYKIKATYNGDEYYFSKTSKTSDIEAGIPKNKVEKFVASLYRIALGREPDAAGYQKWVEQLQSKKMSGADVAYGILFSSEMNKKGLNDKEFIIVLYKILFNRQPDAQGLKNWQNALDIGASRKYVFAGMVQSSEWDSRCKSIGILPGLYASDEPRDKNLQVTAFVQRLYRMCLDRNADIAGLNKWTTGLNRKTTSGVDVAKGFVFSKELENRKLKDNAYVEMLYQALLGRKADAVGRAKWLAQMNAGMSRKAVFEGFANSKEFADLCTRYGIEQGRV